MCGIAGTLGFEPEVSRVIIERACDYMIPRGPDDGGVELFDSGGLCVGLGNRRLAIIDPSPAGHQPMVDRERGIALTFNGMVYNFDELRRHLVERGETFRSSCDTEVVLRAYGYYGPDFLQHLRGMFAIAIWDERRNHLLLARDRLGIKPVYFHNADGRVVFASQVKALLASGIVPFELSPDAIECYLATGAVADPLTIVEGIRSLPAGHSATVTRDGVTVDRWWDYPPSPDPAIGADGGTEELRALLRESVGLHLVSEAPIGVFLSGGLDSSLIASLSVEQRAKVRTVSVTFGDVDYSEDVYIDTVVKHLATEHVDVRLGARELLKWSQEAFAAMDQPSYDGINTFTVSRAAAASGLKVALSGLGADELFNGYGFARRIAQLERLNRLPSLTRTWAGAALGLVPGSRATKPAAWLRGDLPAGAAYELLRRVFLPQEIRDLMPARDGRNAAGRPKEVRAGPRLALDLAVAEMSSYMGNVLLRDTDSMSMSQSLEVRVPFLDDGVVDWSLRVPTGVKGLKPKSMLIGVAAAHVPEDVLARRKMGFVLPLDRWMRNDLFTHIDDLLHSPPPSLSGLLDAQAVRDAWQGYLRGAPLRLLSAQEWLRPWSLYVLYEWITSAQRVASTTPASV